MSDIYVYIGGAKTSLLSLAASSGISYATILARYKAGVAPESLTAGAKAVLDTTPTNGSTNGITSGAVYTAAQALDTAKINKVTGATAGNLPKLKSDGTLEDSGIAYETGTWTPVLKIGDVAVSVTSASGWYEKFGEIIVLDFLIDVGTLAASSDSWNEISGFPFPRRYYQCAANIASSHIKCWGGQFVSATTLLMLNATTHVPSSDLSGALLVGTIVYVTY